MGLERNAESGIMRAQQNSMTLDETAKGYQYQVEEALGNKMGEAVRNEVQTHMNAVLESTGVEQSNALQQLLKRLEPFRAIFENISDDKNEREAFALALVKHEKSLQ